MFWILTIVDQIHTPTIVYSSCKTLERKTGKNNLIFIILVEQKACFPLTCDSSIREDVIGISGYDKESLRKQPVVKS